MIRLNLNVDAPNALLAADALGAGALLRVERAATETGAYTEIDTVAIEADTYQYTYWDPDGSATSWYRWRASNAANTEQTGYSDPFQGSDINEASAASGRYASLADVVNTYGQELTDTRRLQRLDDLLVAGTTALISRLGFSFFRRPQTGTETFVLDGAGGTRLCVHEGIVPGSISLVEVRPSIDDAYESLAAADWYEEPPLKPHHPVFHLRMTGVSSASYSAFPCGRQLVRITGARGWAEIPTDTREALTQRVRQVDALDRSMGHATAGEGDFGAPTAPMGLPDWMWRLLQDYSPMELGTGACYMFGGSS